MTRLKPVTDAEDPAVAALRYAMNAGLTATVVDVSVDGVVTFAWNEAGVQRLVAMHEDLADSLFAEQRWMQ